MKLMGKPVSKGIVIGRVMRYSPFVPTPSVTYLEPNSVENALLAYEETRQRAKCELDEMEAHLEKQDPDKAKIMFAHREILLDPAMDEEVRALVTKEFFSPDAAIEQVYTTYCAVLGRSKNMMMRERASDLRDVMIRMLRCWAGEKECNLSSLDEPIIVVADDLFPSDTVSIDRENVLGIITQVGGATSHTAIIARSYEIPAVLGVSAAMTQLTDGELVVLDAVNGEIVINPNEDEVAEYEALRAKVLAEIEETKAYLPKKPVTQDGTYISLRLNVAAAGDHELTGAEYSDGCGLFRTEFLYLAADRLPDEEEQYKVYKKVLMAFEDKPVILRTMDIGGDKQLERLELPKEDNPFLGVRGLRLCLVRKDLFRTQIRAALRASVHGNLRIMMPMVGALDEIRLARAEIAEQGRLLDEEGIAWNRETPIGIMIEVPSIALVADLVADEVDFVSVGTNDLCQYLCAADRMNPAVKPYYQDYHPGMFRILGTIASTFAAAGKPVSICGELGGDMLAIPALVGLGIDKLSMGLSSMAAAKRVIRDLDMEEAKALAAEIVNLKTESEIRARLQAFANRK